MILTTIGLFFATLANAQTIRVEGRVLDEENLPIIGACIFVGETTTNGTISDIDGHFTVEADKNDVLIFSCIGFLSKTVNINGQSIINVTLSTDSALLDEAVVVGYGVQKKANLSGAVSTVKMDDVIGDRPQPNIAAALQGAIPGLTVTTTSNQPGQTNKSINIRGTSTFSGNQSSISGIEPLVLIDNVPGNLDAINPNDIESVTVLKDASSSAIYGARAAAGVILITTKRPSTGDNIRVTYSGTVGLSNAISTPEQLGLEEYLGIYAKDINISGKYDASEGQDIQSWLKYLNMYKTSPSSLNSLGTLYEGGVFMANEDGLRYFLQEEDIYKRMIETGSTFNNDLSVSGATKNTIFRISANSFKENGPLYGDKDTYSRKTINSFVSAKISKWFTQELNVYYTQQDREMFESPVLGAYSTGIFNYLPDGTIHDAGTGEDFLFLTPRNVINCANTKSTIKKSPRIFTKSIISPIVGLDIVFEYTHNSTESSSDYFSGNYTLNSNRFVPQGGLEHDFYIHSSETKKRNSINVYSTYSHDFGAHHFSIMAGFNQESWKSTYYESYGEDEVAMEIPSLKNAQGIKKISDEYLDYALRSGFARLNYNYKDKYIVELSGRYDGSSKFPKESRFGFFPSFSAAWNIAKEEFLDCANGWLNQLKPRFSYGSIGNEASAGYYDYISTMSVITDSVIWLTGNENEYVTTLGIPAIVSDNYSWEVITTLNAGLDFALLGNRLSGSFEVFQRDTKQILSEGLDVSVVLGAKAPLQNVGSLRTRGWEFQALWKDNIGSDFRYSIGLNLFDYKSKVTAINGNASNLYNSLYVGKNTGEIWGYEWDGFYTKDDFSDDACTILKEGITSISGITVRPGDYKYVNLKDGDLGENDKNVINSGLNTTEKPGDTKVIGNRTPRYQYGIQLSAGYKGIDLSVMIQGIGKRQYFDNSIYFTTLGQNTQASTMPIFKGTEDYWSPLSRDISDPNYMIPSNPNASLPRLYDSGNTISSNYVCSTHTLRNASYMRVKNITISYDFPKKWMNKLNVQNLHLFGSIENPFTLSHLPDGIDPETMSWSYPLYCTVSFGLKLTL